VLKAPDIPSALIETAFISNPDEERRLNDDAYQEKLAGAIVRGVKQYFIKHPPGPKARLAALG
jgi:N-acetylmuramoyl-L-alanine amidase